MPSACRPAGLLERGRAGLGLLAVVAPVALGRGAKPAATAAVGGRGPPRPAAPSSGRAVVTEEPRRGRLERSGAQSAAGRNSLSSSSSCALGLGADQPLGRLAVLEHDQGRDAHHVEAHGQIGVVVDVELGDRHLAACSAAISSRMGRSSCRARTTRPRSRRPRRCRWRRRPRRRWLSVRVVDPSAIGEASFRRQQDRSRGRSTAAPDRLFHGRPVEHAQRQARDGWPRASARRRWRPCSPSRRR